MFYLYMTLALIIIFVILAIIQKLTGVNKIFKRTASSVMLGIIAIATINLSAQFTGVYLPVSLLSLGIAATGGIPAVTLMLLLNLII